MGMGSRLVKRAAKLAKRKRPRRPWYTYRGMRKNIKKGFYSSINLGGEVPLTEDEFRTLARRHNIRAY